MTKSTIIAVKWTGDNLKQVIDLAGRHKSVNRMNWEDYEKLVKEHGLKINLRGIWYTIPIGAIIMKENERFIILEKREE